MQLVRKISPATVFGGKEEILKLVVNDQGKTHELFQVYGIANGTRTGQNKFDDAKEGERDSGWTALLGQFRATNLITGEVFDSGVCFMPNYVTDAVAGKLGPDTDGVEFAFTITAKFDGKSATSYIYGAIPHIEPTEDDPLERMARAIPALKPPQRIAQVEDKRASKTK